MTDTDQAAQSKKEAMKQLRAERKDSIRRVATIVKNQKKDLKLLKEQIGSDGATAPEIAEAIKMEVSRVIWYLATLKQYGEVAEGSKDGCFFRYTLVAQDSA